MSVYFDSDEMAVLKDYLDIIDYSDGDDYQRSVQELIGIIRFKLDTEKASEIRKKECDTE